MVSEVKSLDLVSDTSFMEDKLVIKIVNKFMKSGKKATSEKIFCSAMEKLIAILQERKDGEMEVEEGVTLRSMSPKSLVAFIIKKISPTVEVRSKRVGGSNYQIPVPVSGKRSMSLACTWLVLAVQSRSERGAILRLCNEMLDILNGKGSSLKRKGDVHKMVDANKAFAHFANKL